MKFIKSHLFELILSFLILLILGACLAVFLFLWFGGSGDKYGNRIDGIEKVEITENRLSEIEDKIKTDEVVNKVTSNIKGRIINFTITVNENTNVDKAKSLTDLVISNFEENELSFYDMQVYLLEDPTNEESRYPFIGYKHKTSTVFVWSNN